jgi:hypothetical protein
MNNAAVRVPTIFMKSRTKKWNSQKLNAKVEIPVATSARCGIRLISRPINSFGGRAGAFSGMDRVGASVARSFVVNGSRGGLVAKAIQPRRSYAFARICPINRCVEYVLINSRRFVAAPSEPTDTGTDFISQDGDFVYLDGTRIVVGSVAAVAGGVRAMRDSTRRLTPGGINSDGLHTPEVSRSQEFYCEVPDRAIAPRADCLRPGIVS